MKIKRAARTVILDEDNRTAIVTVRGGDYYKIPGGGIEEGETDEQGARREAREEAGCEVELLEILGENKFVDLQDPNRIHQSICFLAKKIGNQASTSFDEWEKSNDFSMTWMTIGEALQKFEQVNTDDRIGKLINQRDMEFLKKAKQIIDNRK